jgi:hypothetical protein
VNERKCTGCARAMNERPYDFCPLILHWHAYADRVDHIASALVRALPACKECEATATMTRYDATDDPWPACEAHAKPGGMEGDEAPTERAYAKPLRELLAAIRFYTS